MTFVRVEVEKNLNSVMENNISIPLLFIKFTYER